MADKSVRILVGIFAVLGVIASSFSQPNSSVPLTVGFISVVIAIVLNVTPLGEREKFHAELFRGWSELRKDTEKLDVSVCSLTPTSKVKPHHFGRFQELADKAHALHASEPAPWKNLLVECQRDEIESQWGEGIRTTADVDRERSIRLADPTAGPSSVVEVVEG